MTAKLFHVEWGQLSSFDRNLLWVFREHEIYELLVFGNKFSRAKCSMFITVWFITLLKSINTSQLCLKSELMKFTLTLNAISQRCLMEFMTGKEIWKSTEKWVKSKETFELYCSCNETIHFVIENEEHINGICEKYVLLVKICKWSKQELKRVNVFLSLISPIVSYKTIDAPETEEGEKKQRVCSFFSPFTWLVYVRLAQTIVIVQKNWVRFVVNVSVCILWFYFPDCTDSLCLWLVFITFS